VEGADLVQAGLAAGWRPQAVFVAEARAAELAPQLVAATQPGGRPAAVFPVTERVAQRLTTLETPPDVLAVFPLPARRSLAGLRADAQLLVLYTDGIADPGNMGTLVRAAAAFGAAALVASPGSVDLFAPKTVRASMGAIFGLPVFPDVPLAEVRAQLGLEYVYGLVAHGGIALAGADLRRPAALVVGAERAGLSAATLPYLTDPVTIPLTPAVPGAVESLNAGVAGAIGLYEFSRRLTKG
jgi:TrmH family RNA methyltransferase